MSKAQHKKQFFLLSLGCSKNTVDSNSMADLLLRAGFDAADDPDDASVLIVNTCGFIESARQESVSYTHLDVYKRQRLRRKNCFLRWALLIGS